MDAIHKVLSYSSHYSHYGTRSAATEEKTGISGENPSSKTVSLLGKRRKTLQNSTGDTTNIKQRKIAPFHPQQPTGELSTSLLVEHSKAAPQPSTVTNKPISKPSSQSSLPQVKNPIVEQAMNRWLQQFCSDLREEADSVAPCYSILQPDVKPNKVDITAEDVKQTLYFAAEEFESLLKTHPETIDFAELVTDLTDISWAYLPKYQNLHEFLQKHFSPESPHAPKSENRDEALDFFYNQSQKAKKVVDKLKAITENLKQIQSGNKHAAFSLDIESNKTTVLRNYYWKPQKELEDTRERKVVVRSILDEPFSTNRHMEREASNSIFTINKGSRIRGDCEYASLHECIGINLKYQHVWKEWDGKLFHGSLDDYWKGDPQNMEIEGGCSPQGFYTSLDPLQQPYSYATKCINQYSMKRLMGQPFLRPPIGYLVEVETDHNQEWDLDENHYPHGNNSGGIILLGEKPNVKVNKVYLLPARIQILLDAILGYRI